jgi:uncharacterized protein
MSTEMPGSPQPGGMSQDERTWGMACHLAALAMFVVPSIGNILGPLIVWLIQKDKYPFVDSQGKEALNFNISVTIYAYALGILSLTIVALLITVPAITALGVFWLVEVIMATVRANQGEPWKYPLTIQFIK